MIDKKDVEKTAHLARIQLKEDELNQYQNQLQAVLNHFDAIKEVDTNQVEPMYSPVLELDSNREDIVEIFEARNEALENAPDLQGRLFRVPPVV